MAINIPNYYLLKPRKASKNPGILNIEGFKFCCIKTGMSKEDDMINFFYQCADRKEKNKKRKISEIPRVVCKSPVPQKKLNCKR